MAKNENSALNKKSKGEKIVFGIMFIVFLIYAISLLYPLVWLLINSLKYNSRYLADMRFGLVLPKPGEWQFENYLEAFSAKSGETDLIGMFFNSIWTCVLSIVVNMFVSSCTGYVLSKYNFKGRDFIYAAAIVCMTLPVFGTGGARYTFYYQVGLFNTPGYIIFSSLGAFGTRFLMLYGFFKGISWEYAEAVFIDGGNDFTVFFKIMLPLAFPMIMTLSIVGFIGLWNSYEAYLVYLPSFPTLGVGLYKMQRVYANDLPVYYAVMILTVIPIITLFAVFSDTIMQNFSIGGIKG